MSAERERESGLTAAPKSLPSSGTPPYTPVSRDRVSAVSYTHLDVYKRQGLTKIQLYFNPLTEISWPGDSWDKSEVTMLQVRSTGLQNIDLKGFTGLTDMSITTCSNFEATGLKKDVYKRQAATSTQPRVMSFVFLVISGASFCALPQLYPRSGRPVSYTHLDVYKRQQTAYGALHDNLATCGGYAQALQQLFQKAGIPCYTVSGEMGSEYHMWNIAYLDGEWRYFDATSDRGRADYWFNCFNVGADDLTRYVWDRDFTELLTQADI